MSCLEGMLQISSRTIFVLEKLYGVRLDGRENGMLAPLFSFGVFSELWTYCLT